MEVELYLFLRREEFQYLYQNLSNLRIELNVVLRFFTYFVSEESQAVLYFFIALFLQLIFHVIKTVEKLKKSDEATYDLDLKEAFFFGFVFRKVVVGLGDLCDDENSFLYL